MFFAMHIALLLISYLVLHLFQSFLNIFVVNYTSYLCIPNIIQIATIKFDFSFNSFGYFFIATSSISRAGKAPGYLKT